MSRAPKMRPDGLIQAALDRCFEPLLIGMLRLVGFATSTPAGAFVAAKCSSIRHPLLEVHCLGRTLSNPVGLAAGFDKDCLVGSGFGIFGFGFIEVGTVLCRPQPGHRAPRVFLQPRDRAIVNRMGSPSAGLGVVKARMERGCSGNNMAVAINVGVSQGASYNDMVTELTDAAEAFSSMAWYLCLNVSSPNTAALRGLQQADLLRGVLRDVLTALDPPAQGRSARRRPPVLLKISPDLSDSEIVAVANLAMDMRLAGIVATNTTRAGNRAAGTSPDGRGGLSGRPLKARSLEVLRRLHHETAGQLLLISVGGLETVDDVWERILAGATLVQGYTGFLFGGPLWVWRLRRGLSQRVERAGYDSIRDAVGAGNQRSGPR